jgi:hypothetical protein
MKRNDLLYLLAVAAFSVVFTVIVFSDAAAVIARGAAEPTYSPTAGEPRDVDLERIKRLLRSRDLSDREALHYKPVEDDD